MKKLLLIALAFSISTISFAQKKELKSAEKAIKKSNYAEAKSAIAQAEALLGSMDEKSKNKFYLLKGKALYAGGAGSESDFDMAVKSLKNLNNSTEASDLISLMINTFLTKGNTAYESSDFKTSSKYFERAYRVSTADTSYLYYAASAAVNGKDYDNALTLYNELKDLKYSGIETESVAFNKETNKVEVFESAEMRDISVKAGTHIKPQERPTESKSAEIIKNIALIYVQKGEDENAVAALNEARKLNPDDSNLLLTEANIYYKLGNKEKFQELISEASAKDPNNAELIYNLGVVSADSGEIETAKKYYKRAIEIDPTYSSAQINLAALILADEAVIIEKMNNLGTSNADYDMYDKLELQRKGLYKEAIPYLESVMETNPNNIQAAKTLMSIYSAIEEDEKFKAMKAKVEALESGGN
ncbi:MAG: tetratricopeptide repeat protein [Crocinitomicaceae bacterium]